MFDTRDPEIGYKLSTLAAIGRTVHDMVKDRKDAEYIGGWVIRQIAIEDKRIKKEEA